MNFDKGACGKGCFGSPPPAMGSKGFDGKGLPPGAAPKGLPTGQFVPPPQGMPDYQIFDAGQGSSPAPFMNGSFAKAAPMPGGLAPELLALTEAENIAPP